MEDTKKSARPSVHKIDAQKNLQRLWQPAQGPHGLNKWGSRAERKSRHTHTMPNQEATSKLLESLANSFSRKSHRGNKSLLSCPHPALEGQTQKGSSGNFGDSLSHNVKSGLFLLICFTLCFSHVDPYTVYGMAFMFFFFFDGISEYVNVCVCIYILHAFLVLVFASFSCLAVFFIIF